MEMSTRWQGQSSIDLGQTRKKDGLEPFSLPLLLQGTGTNVVTPQGTCRVRDDLKYKAALWARQPELQVPFTAAVGAGITVAGDELPQGDSLSAPATFTPNDLKRRLRIDRSRLSLCAQKGLALRQYPLIVQLEFFVTVAAATRLGLIQVIVVFSQPAIRANLHIEPPALNQAENRTKPVEVGGEKRKEFSEEVYPKEYP